MSDAFPPPDPDAAVQQHGYVDAAAAPPPRRRSKAPLAIGALVVVALVGGGAFAVASMSDDEGASSPEEAVDALFAAVGSEDLLGVLDTLAPGERQAFIDGVSDMADELERLGVLADDTDLEAVSGFDLTFADMTYETEQIGTGVSTVTVTGGTVSGSYDLGELPIGDTLLDTVLDGERPQGTDTADGEDVGSDLRITTVERDGGWYVSLWYSVAEAARIGAGLDAPAFGEGLDARGAASPEGAVEALMAAAVALDLEGVLAIMPPDEMGVLHDYAPLFLPDAQEAVSGLEFTSSLDDFSASADIDGDEADVTIDSFALSFTAEGDTASVTYDGDCFAVVLPEGAGAEAGEQRMCRSDLDANGTLEELGLGGLLNGDTQTAVRTVRVDGEWFVSPTRSMFGSIDDALEAVDADSFRDLLTRVDEDPEGFVQELLEGALTGAGMGTAEGGMFSASPTTSSSRAASPRPAPTVPASTSTTAAPTTTTSTTVAPTTSVAVPDTTAASVPDMAPTTAAP